MDWFCSNWWEVSLVQVTCRAFSFLSFFSSSFSFYFIFFFIYGQNSLGEWGACGDFSGVHGSRGGSSAPPPLPPSPNAGSALEYKYYATVTYCIWPLYDRQKWHTMAKINFSFHFISFKLLFQNLFFFIPFLNFNSFYYYGSKFN